MKINLITFLILLYNCSVQAMPICWVNATPVNFGNYRPTANVPTDSEGNIRLKCTDIAHGGLIPIEILLSPGNSKAYVMRALSSATRHQLYYNLYLDPGRHVIWGNNEGDSTALKSKLYVGKENDWPIYGRIFPHQKIPAGQYQDAIVITVNY